MRQIVLDTETTGLETSQGHRIIEIGAVELINRRFTGNHFHYYLNPQRDIDASAQQVHGITTDFLVDKPLFSQISTALLNYIKDAELIIHNANFDIGFLNYEFQLIDSTFSKLSDYCRIIDSLTLARQKHPGQKNSLDALCKRYAIDNTHRNLHGALLDAQLLAHVYLAMTGGQGNLFDDEKPYAIHTDIAVPPLTHTQRPPLAVLYAASEELALHHQRLIEIQEISKNNCIWLQQKTEAI